MIYPSHNPEHYFDFVYVAKLPMTNSLPNDNFFDWSRLKEFADDKIDVT